MKRRSRLLVTVVGSMLVMGACASSSPGDEGRPDPDPDRIGPQGRVAQFVVGCEVSHIAFDDPIVLPWQPGASHQHQFFGNAATNSEPGYERAVGAETSCDQRLDTASYWSPTLLDASGQRIDSSGLTAYYRPGDGVDPADVVAYPPGFMVIAGSSAADEPQGQDVIAWGCGSSAVREDRPPECSENSTLRLWITFPDCWDSSRLTGFGSGAHVRYSDGGCPDSHPIALPQLLMAIDFPPVDPDGLSLSSGSIDSAHADFWNTWDQDKLEREVQLCLNRDLVCGLSG
jgi:hypothetical protein